MAKLYVIPVESACNGKCPYCVNQFRNLGNSFLQISDLEECLTNIGTIDAIEISGGGEPTLHPKIEEIIDLCAGKARTQMYSNGKGVGFIAKYFLKKLNPLCISRAHFDSDINARIMGVRYDDEIFSRGLNIKLSAVLFKGGVDSPEEAKKYIDWAKNKAKKVVFRPLFGDVIYPNEIREKMVSLDGFANYFGFKVLHKNPVLNIDGLEVEFETRSCSCENSNQILHANGELNYSWSKDDTDGSRN